eukprot:3941007-Rhodomonas_salina.4
MSGTDIVVCYAMSGTDIAYGATRPAVASASTGVRVCHVVATTVQAPFIDAPAPFTDAPGPFGKAKAPFQAAARAFMAATVSVYRPTIPVQCYPEKRLLVCDFAVDLYGRGADPRSF